ncbi:MAG TPA: hypothetical protein VFD39_13990 [Trueperaceae bacterium]|nr:hypothetical protein [Trueperaceae bacterium]
MATFTIGEEVLHDGRRYVITLKQPLPPYRYRLARTTSAGPEIHWARADELHKMVSYTTPRADTPARG